MRCMEIWGRERNVGFHEELITLAIDKCIQYKSEISFIFVFYCCLFWCRSLKLNMAEHRLAVSYDHRAGLDYSPFISIYYSFYEFVGTHDRRGYEAIDWLQPEESDIMFASCWCTLNWKCFGENRLFRLIVPSRGFFFFYTHTSQLEGRYAA